MLALIAPATSATLLLIALLVWQQIRLPGHRDLAVCLCLGAAYFLYHADRELFSPLLPVLFLGPYACNRAMRSSFELSKRPPWFEGMTIALLVGSGILGYISPRLWLAAQAFNMLSLLLFVEIVSFVKEGIDDDLINTRRAARIWLLSLSGGLGLFMAIASISRQTEFAVTVGGSATLLLGFVTVALGPSLLEPVQATPVASEKSGLDPRETLILRRLEGVMRTEAIYRDPNLSLSRLAQRLDVPEHRLRRVIHLGTRHRNFSHYIHAYRLNDFKTRIDNPYYDAETILSLAVSVGYSSLSVFNRAFKAHEGTTPRDYRTARMVARIANPNASALNTAEAPSVTKTA